MDEALLQGWTPGSRASLQTAADAARRLEVRYEDLSKALHELNPETGSRLHFSRLRRWWRMQKLEQQTERAMGAGGSTLSMGAGADEA
uniref:Uncharacterized protein n=1 Tax=Haptolina ericina TaxID=156174 RepID=A0A7S3FGI7_9EUKA